MASQYTIQLREAEDTTTHRKGEFSVPLKKDLFLEQGDSVVVRQTFLDCVSDGKVRILNADPYDTSDVTITISYGTYLTNTLSEDYAHMFGFADDGVVAHPLELFADAAQGATELKFKNTSNTGSNPLTDSSKGVVGVNGKDYQVESVSIGTGDDSTLDLGSKLADAAATGDTVLFHASTVLTSPDYGDYVLMNVDSAPGTELTVASVSSKEVTMSDAIPSKVQVGMYLRTNITSITPSVSQITKIDSAAKKITVKDAFSHVTAGAKFKATYLGEEVQFWGSFQVRAPALTEQEYLTASWTDLNNKTKYKQVEVNNPELWTEHPSFSINEYMRTGSASVVLNTNVTMMDMGVKPVKSANEETHLAHPNYRTIAFSLPVGYYTPQTVCKKMNDQIQKLSGIGIIEDAGNANLIQNTGSQLLITSKQLSVLGEQLVLVRADGNRYVRPTTAPFWLGAPELAVFYDDDSGTFGFERMHLSLYSSETSGNEVSLIGIAGNSTHGDGSANSAGQVSYVGRAGGVFITDLEPKSVWGEQMGFSGTMAPTLERAGETKVFFDGTNILKSNPLTLPDLDAHTTTMFTSASAFMNQKPTANTGNNDVSGTNSAVSKIGSGNPVEVDGSNFTQLFATNSVDRTSSETVPYLMIELGGLPNVQHSGTATKSVAQVVGKYYSTGRCVSSSGEGVAYTHLGEAPIQISKLGCRILNPDGSLAETGGDTTVFLEVVKAQQQPTKAQK